MWTIGTKISAGYVLALAALLTIGMVSFFNTQTMYENTQMVDYTYTEIIEIGNLQEDIEEIQLVVRNYILTGDETFINEQEMLLASVEKHIETVTELLSINPTLTAEFEALKADINNLLKRELALVRMYDLQGHDRAMGLLNESNSAVARANILDGFDHIQKELGKLLEQRITASEAAESMTRNTIIYGISGAFVVMTLAGYIITTNITRPLSYTTEIAEKIATGDLDIDVQYSTRADEVGTLVRSFDKMATYLRNTASVAKQIAVGELEVSFSLQSDKDMLGKAFGEMIQSWKSLVDATDRIAAGDLTVRIDPKSDNDRMGNALSKMVRSLNQIISEIIDGVNVLNEASTEIQELMTIVSSGASETATSVNETSSTVEQVKQSANFASEKSKAVSEITQKTVQASQDGLNSVDKSVTGMNEIQDQVEFIAESLVRLSEQSQAIGEIISTVNDLAEQSNLLAVNASIEAAKAGEQGKGFAVVAQEVKVLAEQSKDATRQVRTILNDILKATNNAVMATEQGNKAVEAGVVQTRDAGKAIRQMGEHIDKAAQSALQIEVTNQQQLAGMDQIITAMESIQLASEKNLDGTKQIDSSVQNLHELGSRLKHMVDRFVVHET